jgi:signal transduction histidine kinase
VRWWRRRTLRARLTLLSAAGLAVGLAIGGALIVYLLHQRLVHSVDAASRQTASDVSELVIAGQVPNPIPNVGTTLVQVVDDRQHVVASTAGVNRLTPMLTPAEQQRALNGTVVVSGQRVHETVDGKLRVVVAHAVDPNPVTGGPRLIIVATSTHAADESVETVTTFLLVVYPLLVVLLSALAWQVVGWTLRPVETLRRSADQISAGDRNVGLLPVPDGDDEVHRLAVTLNDMLGRLDAGRARQRAFVADAAHELRSPIASLRTQIEVAAHMNEPPLNDDLLTDIARLNRLVDDLLLLARADEGDPRLQSVEVVDLTAVARTAVDGYGQARVPVRLAAGDPVWTPGDAVALRRVIENLVTNAVRHASTGVAVEVTTPDDDVVRLTVTDDGPGIPAEDRERVFDRFTRLDNARDRDQGGAGLGLPIVRELLRLHQATITLSDATPGLKVTVDLPAPGPGVG